MTNNNNPQSGPRFDFDSIANTKTITDHITDLTKPNASIEHKGVLLSLLDQVEKIDFKALAFDQVDKIYKALERLPPDDEKREELTSQLSKMKIKTKHYLISSIEHLLKIANKNHWGLCKNQEFIYIYNGAYWKEKPKDEFEKFLGEAAEKMGVEKFEAKYYVFRDQLFKQFLSTAYLPKPDTNKDLVYINLQNGTFEISANKTNLRPFDKDDFLTYQLPFDYDKAATAPMFQKYLDRVLPDKECQRVLAEYLGYVFIQNGSRSIKLEKTLLLYGIGANGKSVFFEVVKALLGNENISHYSIQSLTDVNGYYRAALANKLVNYASEIGGKMNPDILKQMVSGEPIEARLPYGRPMILDQYARLIFNCNQLPKDVEQTNAFFRRFLIIPFEVTIPKEERDTTLHIKIIDNELSGVFNWVLSGLHRLINNKGLSDCKAADKILESYQKESDSVQMFISENEYKKDATSCQGIKVLYSAYREFCIDDGYKSVNRKNFCKRLENRGFFIQRRSIGKVVFLIKGTSDE